MTEDENKEIRNIGLNGRSSDTDYVDGYWGATIRRLVDSGLVKRSRLNNRQTWLELTTVGRAALEAQ